MKHEAVNVLKPLDKHVLKEPPGEISITFVKDEIHASFDNVHIPLTPAQVSELHGYCERVMGIYVCNKKK